MTNENGIAPKGKGTAEIKFVLRDKDGNIKDREIVKVKLDGTTDN